MFENPWFTIWTHPRYTIRQVLPVAGEVYILLLAAANGCLIFLAKAIQNHLGEEVSLPEIILLSLTVGVFAGIIHLYLFAQTVSWSGKLIGGDAEVRDIRIGIAFGAIPIIWILGFVFLFTIPIFGIDLFLDRGISNWRDIPGIFKIALIVSPVWMLSLGWIAVIHLKILAEIQGFSIWKALLNNILAILVLMLIVFSITGPIVYFTGTQVDRILILLGF